jgi:NDP-sugar pyrophosphorylase family protein
MSSLWECFQGKIVLFILVYQGRGPSLIKLIFFFIVEETGMYNTLFLAGGYGTRFQKQVPPDSFLSKLPKGLLPLNGKSLLSKWIEQGIDNVYIMTNDLYLEAYRKHSNSVLGIASNKTTKNENRLGSIGDLQLALVEFNLYSQDLLVIASDIYFLGFDYKSFINYCCQNQVIVVLYYKIKDENVCKSGIIELDSDSRVIKFLEKPALTDTESRLGCPCFYYFPASVLSLIDEFMEETRGDLAKVDASGKLIQWLIGKTTIQGYPLNDPKLDIGDYQSYLDANDLITKYE